MTSDDLRRRLREVAAEKIPLPAGGDTLGRLRRFAQIGLEDLSLAKLAEAHWDAIAILAEDARMPTPGTTYAVWASEPPSDGLRLLRPGEGMFVLRGAKPFCSGLAIVDRALVTVRDPIPLLLDIDLRQQTDRFEMDWSDWTTDAFRSTQTGTIKFDGYMVGEQNVVGPEDFYLKRAGFWNGACGPAACWVGGAAGLVAYARQSKREDAHTLAHLGAMGATLWMMETSIDQAARDIDIAPNLSPMVRALRVRHIVEQGCSDILRRLTRAYGPSPLAFNSEISRRYQELDLFLRQTHAERDLEVLGGSLSCRQ